MVKLEQTCRLTWRPGEAHSWSYAFSRPASWKTSLLLTKKSGSPQNKIHKEHQNFQEKWKSDILFGQLVPEIFPIKIYQLNFSCHHVNTFSESRLRDFGKEQTEPHLIHIWFCHRSFQDNRRQYNCGSLWKWCRPNENNQEKSGSCQQRDRGENSCDWVSFKNQTLCKTRH